MNPHTFTRVQIGNGLRAWREKLGLTQYNIAHVLGLTTTAVYSKESGHVWLSDEQMDALDAAHPGAKAEILALAGIATPPNREPQTPAYLKPALALVERPSFQEVFDGHPLTFVMFRGEPVVVARELGAALGYADPGRLAVLVRDEWAAEFRAGDDYHLLRGDALGDFKRLTPHGGGSSIDPRTPSLLILTESGLWQVAQKTEKELGVRLRRFLTDKVLPKLARGESIPAPTAPVRNEVNADRLEALGDKLAGVDDIAGAAHAWRAAARALGAEMPAA